MAEREATALSKRNQKHRRPEVPGQTLSLFSLTMLVVASMIGAGVYTTSGFAMGDLGSPHWVMTAWGVGALVAICGAVSYGLLAKRLCDNGGEYLYLSHYVHPSLGFVAGWVSFLAGFTGAAALAAITFDQYSLPAESRPWWLPAKTFGIALILITTLIHCRGPRSGVVSQNVFVSIKVGLLIAFILLSYGAISGWHCFLGPTLNLELIATPGPYAFSTTVMWVSLSYTGFNAAIYVAGQAAGGAVGVRRSMVLGTLGVSVLYLLLNAAFVYAPDPEAITFRQDVATIAAAAIGGPPLATMVRVVILIGLATSVSSVLMTGPRVYAKMAADGYFPSWFAATSAAPRRSIVLQGLAILIVVVIAGLPNLLSYLGMTLSLSSAATVATLAIKSHDDVEAKSHDDVEATWSRFRPIHGFALAYVLATAAIIVMATIHRPNEAIASIGTILIGLLFYWTARHRFRGHSEQARER